MRRISRMTLGTFLRREVAGPLGIDAHIGFGPEHDHRVAEMIVVPPAPGEPSPVEELMKDPESMRSKGLLTPPPT